jgi:eukaryotic-like serine/threonine-protein kinase
MVENLPADLSADVLGGRYRLGEVIGRGGMASVYLATDENLGRDVALKLFAPQPPDSAELKRQEAEIQLLATLTHPNLITLFDAGTDTRVPEEPRPFLTMELVDGQDLRSRIRQGPISLDELAVIGAGIADALAYVHDQGIIHRDLKPANILLVQIRPGEPLRPKLTDFGIARILDETRLTATGTMVGTAAYLSPEQAMGAPTGPASDIYSLGLVLLECIKGSVEYPGSPVESAVARLHRAPEIPEDLPQEWAQLLRSMTAIEPQDRPTAADVELALRHALISSESMPAPLPDQATHVFPAPPSRLPLVATDADPDAVRDFGPDLVTTGGTRADAAGPRSRRGTGPILGVLRRMAVRSWAGAAVLIAVLLAVIVAVMMAVSAPKAPDVVPYPSVTGTLGESLEKLQKSVDP